MKQRLRRVMGGLALHLVVSGAVLGAVRVYQQGYNTTHREQLQMASVSIQSDQTELQILGRNYFIPTQMLSEDSMLYYVVYFMTDGYLHSWMYGIAEFMNRT